MLTNYDLEDLYRDYNVSLLGRSTTYANKKWELQQNSTCLTNHFQLHNHKTLIINQAILLSPQ